MADHGHELQFGIFVPPQAAAAGTALELARLADVAGLDLVTVQDHPYQAAFLDAWTLLSVIAAQTSRVRVAPNVANLPLRPPVVLARSVASLDILSGGRAELGLGAGAFWDAIAAVGGPRRTPGESVDALTEAIAIIRAVWNADGPSLRPEGEHYRVRGAHPGPAPAHDVEIWLGAYKPRMLRLTGAQADGWLPSMGYIEIEALPAANAAIDAAAVDAGRAPADVRRMLNVNGSIGTGAGFLEGGPADWAQQLAGLTLSAGMSTYILSVSTAAEVQRFAEEVAPAVRDLVAAERAGAREPVAVAPAFTTATPAATPFASAPTPHDGRRLSDEQPWDETTRPSVRASLDQHRDYTPQEQAAGRHLIDVHDHLRAELTQLRDLVEQVASGTTDPSAVRSHITRMTIRQNNWTLGTFCETYCRVVTNHHTLEDRSVFPHLVSSEPALGPVIDRLEEEHGTISELLERVDRALIGLVSSDGAIADVHRAIDLLTDALLSHFSYEESELIEPLARHGFY